jgi:hypothetical protein
MAASPKDEVEKRKADGAHKTRGRKNQQPVEAPATLLTVTAPQTLGQQERVERAAHRKKILKKKIEDARGQK